jgi:membrane-bound serine protease (ClpP class)
MEAILLNPNVLYIFLVLGFLLVILAILTPGTGILEIGALFALFFTGWGIFNAPVNVWAVVLVILGAAPFVILVRRRGGRTYLALSLAALFVGAAFLFRGAAWWQPAANPLLMLLVTALGAGYLWIAAVKVLESESSRPSHDLSGLIGAVGEAKTDVYGEGSIQVHGELWSARSLTPIAAGAQVRVTGREGFILEVAAIEEQRSPIMAA